MDELRPARVPDPERAAATAAEVPARRTCCDLGISLVSDQGAVDAKVLAPVDLWGSATGKANKIRVAEHPVDQLMELVTRSVTDFAPIADPADLAKVLARQARDAKSAFPADLKPIARLSHIPILAIKAQSPPPLLLPGRAHGIEGGAPTAAFIAGS